MPDTRQFAVIDSTPIQQALDWNIGFKNRPGMTYLLVSQNPAEAQARVHRIAQIEPPQVPKPQWWLCIIIAVALIVVTGAPVWSMWAAAALVVGSILRQFRAMRRWSRWRSNVLSDLGYGTRRVMLIDARKIFEHTEMPVTFDMALATGDPNLAGRFVWAVYDYEHASLQSSTWYERQREVKQRAVDLVGSCQVSA